MSEDLLHNTVCITHGSGGIGGKKLQRWEWRIRNNRRGNTACFFSPHSKIKKTTLFGQLVPISIDFGILCHNFKDQDI